MATGTWTINGPSKRLESGIKLTAEHFHAIARQLGVAPMRARKIGYVAAQRAEGREVVETRWNGTETRNTARRGDWVVTNLSPRREPLRDREGHENRDVIAAKRFPELYAPAEGGEKSAKGEVYRAKGVVSALQLEGGFDIVAPWGERQTAPAGYLILNGEEVYGNNAEIFAATYEAVQGGGC
jgi:hypothetical protein